MFLINQAEAGEDRCAVCRPARPGCRICNPLSGKLGTLGGWATSDGADRWIISCYHVLARAQGTEPTPAVAGPDEPIFQPAAGVGPGPVATTAGLRALAHRAHDFAAARADPAHVCGAGYIGLDGVPTPMVTAAPRLGMWVIKSGSATGITRGRIVEQRTDGRFDPPMWVVEVDFDDEETGDRLVAPGDSGAFWIDRETGAAIAMHTGETMEQTSTAVVLKPLLERVGLRLV